MNRSLLFSDSKKRIHPINLSIYESFWEKREKNQLNSLKPMTDPYEVEKETEIEETEQEIDLKLVDSKNDQDLIQWRSFHLWVHETMEKCFTFDIKQFAWDLAQQLSRSPVPP